MKDQNAVLNTENFPQTALDAVTYQGHAVAYPLYFETSALVYNRTYLEQAAAELETDEASLIPKTIDDIRNFADAYNAPETVESLELLAWMRTKISAPLPLATCARSALLNGQSSVSRIITTW